MGSNQDFIASFSAVPEKIITGTDITTRGLGISPSPIYFTLITSMFMHSCVAHITGNMPYLRVFGDNLENVMEHKNACAFIYFVAFSQV